MGKTLISKLFMTCEMLQGHHPRVYMSNRIIYGQVVLSYHFSGVFDTLGEWFTD